MLVKADYDFTDAILLVDKKHNRSRRVITPYAAPPKGQRMASI